MHWEIQPIIIFKEPKYRQPLLIIHKILLCRVLLLLLKTIMFNQSLNKKFKIFLFSRLLMMITIHIWNKPTILLNNLRIMIMYPTILLIPNPLIQLIITHSQQQHTWINNLIHSVNLQPLMLIPNQIQHTLINSPFHILLIKYNLLQLMIQTYLILFILKQMNKEDKLKWENTNQELHLMMLLAIILSINKPTQQLTNLILKLKFRRLPLLMFKLSQLLMFKPNQLLMFRVLPNKSILSM